MKTLIRKPWFLAVLAVVVLTGTAVTVSATGIACATIGALTAVTTGAGVGAATTIGAGCTNGLICTSTKYG